MLFEHLGNKKYFWQKFYDLYEEININKETPYMPKLLSFAQENIVVPTLLNIIIKYIMQNLPLVHFRLTLKGRNMAHPHQPTKKEGQQQISQTTTRGYTPMHIESKDLRKNQGKSHPSNLFRKSQQKDRSTSELGDQMQEQLKVQVSLKQIKKQLTKTKIRKTSLHFGKKKCTCGDCEGCLKDFNYFLHIFSNDLSIPEISAKSWCIWRKGKNDKFIYYYGKRIHKIRQIASLTKMITAMVTIDFLRRYNYDPDQITFAVRKGSIMIGGTTALLKIGQVYTITELLHGLMLPSGNDAAIAIGEAIGLIQFLKYRNKFFNPYQANWYEDFLQNPNKNYSYIFITLMNEKCKKLSLRDTHMFNSHGNDAYDQLKNVSTCNEVARISSQFISKYQQLKMIVTTKKFEVQRHAKVWQNTNKLLDDGFQGIKTGITETAGPCLAAYYKDLVIVVLNSKSMNERWSEVKKLVKWFIKKTL